MNKIIKTYKRLSLDVCLGALSGGMFFTKLWNSNVPRFFYLALPVAVWIIYSIDHLLDGLNAKTDNSFNTYSFHLKHKYVFLTVCAFLGVALVVSSYHFFYFPVFEHLVYILLLIGLYYTINHFKPIPALKEIFIALVYCLGIAYVPFFHEQVRFTFTYIIIFIIYFMAVEVNVLLFALIEKKQDAENDRNTIVNLLGEGKVKTVIYTLIVVGVLASLILMLGEISKIYSILLLALLSSEFILIFSRAYIRKTILSAIILDGVFIIPSLVYFLR